MRLFLYSLGVLVLLGQPAAARAGDYCSLWGQALRQAAEIRGLDIRSPAGCRTVNRAEFIKRKTAQGQHGLPPDLLRHEELMYKALGLIPADYPYERCFIRAAARDTLAAFDARTGEVIIPAWLPLRRDVLVHEAVHALQDQHFQLERLHRLWNRSSDSALAGSALSEGDALIVQEAFLQNNPRPEEDEKPVTAHPADACSLPPAIAQQLDFPYDFGAIFVSRLLNKGGPAGLNAAFREPPLSTTEIIHEKRYPDRQKRWRAMQPPALAPFGRRGRLVFSDRLGQYTIRILLSPLEDQGRAILAAKGWDGDVAALYQSGKAAALVWETRWESAEDTEEFLQALRDVLRPAAGADSRSFAFRRHDGALVAVLAGSQRVTVAVLESPRDVRR